MQLILLVLCPFTHASLPPFLVTTCTTKALSKPYSARHNQPHDFSDMPCDYKASKDNIEHFLENSAAYPTPLQSITASQLNELYDSCTWKAPLLEAKDKTNLLTWLARHYPDRKAEGNWSGWVRTVVQKSIDLREQSGVQSDAMDEAMDENYAFNVQGQKDGIGGRVSTKVNVR